MRSIEERVQEHLKAAVEGCVADEEYAVSSRDQQQERLRQARLDAFRQFIDAEREQLRQQTLEYPTGLEMARAHAGVFDSVIGAMYHLAETQARAGAELDPPPRKEENWPWRRWGVMAGPS